MTELAVQHTSRTHHFLPDVFNHEAAKVPPVPYKLSEQKRAKRQSLYQEHYARQIRNVRYYFQLKHHDVANACLDVLLDLKKGKIRKDGYTPDYGHEMDLLLSCISDIENGHIDMYSVEEKYGSLESLLISAISHDLGEDFGLMPEDYKALVNKKLKQNIGEERISDAHIGLICRGAESMERLTHDRHYSIDEFVEKFGREFEKQYGYTLDIPAPQLGQLIDLSDDIKDFLKEKMGELPGAPKKLSKNFQAFLVKDKKGNPRITVTRYGKDKDDGWGACWDAYSEGFMSDPYDATVKFEDSANGMTSRIAIESFTADGGNRYLRKRAQTFKLNRATRRMMSKYPELASNFKSIGDMMGIAYSVVRILLNHDPRMNDNGESGFSAKNLARDENGLIYIDWKDYPERAFDSYALVPGLSNPVARLMRQYKDVVGFYKDADHPWSKSVSFLHKQTRGLFIRDCKNGCLKNGLNIRDLVDKPETVDPFPKIFEKYGFKHPDLTPALD